MTRLTITLCGSLTRARHDLRRVHRALALAGHLVHAPCPPLPGEHPPTAEQHANLAARHYAAINHSDLVIAVTPDGWPGEATGDEIRHATTEGKPVRWLLDPAAVDALISDVAAWLDGAEEKP
ncbi:hypothetical protein ACFWC6_30850 [Micromonospora chalcea]